MIKQQLEHTTLSLFILNVAPDGVTFVAISTKTQVLYQVKINSTSQLINGIFKFLQKLLKCFCGITTFVFVNESLLSGTFPVILVLYLKDSDHKREDYLVDL